MSDDLKRLRDARDRLASDLAEAIEVLAAAERLAIDAEEALKQYGDETAGGGEPVFPRWAKDIQTILKAKKL